MPAPASDDQYATYFTELLQRDLAGRTPGVAARSWEWTCVLLWMAEEARALADSLTISPETRRQMLDLAEQARARARETRQASPNLVPAVL